MAVTDHYDFWHLDPDEEISDFPSTWNYNIDDIDAAIHEAATNNVALSRLPNLPASQTTSGEFADARIPATIARSADVEDETAALKTRIDELENSSPGVPDAQYRQKDVEPDTGTGFVSIERQGPLVFIWASLYFESEVSVNTRVLSIPSWAQTNGICLMPCMTAGADPVNVNLQVSGGTALATADIAADTRIYGSITFLTTKEMGDE